MKLSLWSREMRNPIQLYLGAVTRLENKSLQIYLAYLYKEVMHIVDWYTRVPHEYWSPDLRADNAE